jgi:hypothetical protein
MKLLCSPGTDLVNIFLRHFETNSSSHGTPANPKLSQRRRASPCPPVGRGVGNAPEQQNLHFKPLETIMSIGSRLLLACAFTAGCSSQPEPREIIHNPTGYVFSCNKAFLKKAINVTLGNLQYRNMTLQYVGGPVPLDTLGIFEERGNMDDFYLSPNFIWIGESYVYPRFKYVASFHLHIEQMDSIHSEVIINTIHPRLIVGKEFWPNFPHFAKGYNYKSALPSGVEEYEILFRIGKELNEDMPEVVYPTVVSK